MIEHVVRRAMMCDALDEVYVATCDKEIRIAVEAFGGSVLMTSSDHERASDRVAEAASRIQADIVVMIQGDEPMIGPDMIAGAIAPLLIDPSVGCVNLIKRIDSEREFLDPNTIKVVMNRQGDALYFSRAAIPMSAFTPNANQPVFKQVCVIPFRRDFLLEFARLPPTSLEQTESIDMLRAIEHGRRVRLVETDAATHAVDTPADLQLVKSLMKDDPLLALYDQPILSAEAHA
jgi:3-deoxy-manno-octulosonate cytidylyltransferase (CMP-KDO synthetase)